MARGYTLEVRLNDEERRVLKQVAGLCEKSVSVLVRDVIAQACALVLTKYGQADGVEQTAAKPVRVVEPVVAPAPERVPPTYKAWLWSTARRTPFDMAPAGQENFQRKYQRFLADFEAGIVGWPPE